MAAAGTVAADFAAWLKARGGYLHPGLDLFKELPGGDRGVVATEDVAEGTVLALLPSTCTLYIPTDAELAKWGGARACWGTGSGGAWALVELAVPRAMSRPSGVGARLGTMSHPCSVCQAVPAGRVSGGGLCRAGVATPRAPCTAQHGKTKLGFDSVPVAHARRTGRGFAMPRPACVDT